MNPLTLTQLSATPLRKGKKVVAKLVNILTTAALLMLAAGLGATTGQVRPVWAASFDVNRFDDPAPNGCQQPPAGDCSLREAIIDANASVGVPDTINLPAGTYTLTIAGAGNPTAASGDLDIVDDVTINGSGATIDAAGLGDRVFHISGGGGLPVVSMAGVTITGGLEDVGGGVFNDGGSLTLTNSVVQGNRANGSNGRGGGLYNLGGFVTLTDCTIANNDAVASVAPVNGGGGIFNSNGTLTIDNSNIRDNAAIGNLGYGGGIYNTGGAVTVTNSFLSGNSTSSNPMVLQDSGGGAIYNRGTVTLDNSDVTRNSAFAGSGAGIHNDGGAVTINNGGISDNISDLEGGGVFNKSGFVTVTDSTVRRNSHGGGLHNREGGKIILTRVTVSNNLHDFSGGGGITNYGGTAVVSDSTIQGNASVAGGGIYNGTSALVGLTSIMTVTNSIVISNIAQAGPFNSSSNGGGIYNQAQYGDAALTLVNTQIISNTAAGGANVLGSGGGIYNYAYVYPNVPTGVPTITLIDSVISGNFATQDGGGLYNSWGGVVTLQNSTVNSNTTDFSGGGLLNWKGAVSVSDGLIYGNVAGLQGGGFYSDGGPATLVNTLISGNSATDDGGGLYIGSAIGNSAGLTTTTVSGNSAMGNGGGLYVGGPATLTNSTISGNTAIDGGGLYGRGSLTLENVTLSSNSATNGGGGLYVFGSTTLANSTVSGNSATNGGGLYNDGSYSGLLTVNNVTLSGNSAGNGSGLYSDYLGTTKLNNVTISANSATASAAIYLYNGTIIAANSIIAAQTLGADCFPAIILSAGYNIESGTSCGFTAAGDQQNTVPLLLPLADNGGPTQTHALQANSPAIDAGNPNGCLGDLNGDGALETLTTDQRGVARADMPGVGNAPPDAVCDIGAFEYSRPLANGDLEDDLDGDAIPDDWIGINLGPNDVQNCTLPAHSGLCLFDLRANNTQKVLYQIVPQGGLAGDTYTLSLWSRTKNASQAGKLRARVQFNYADGTTENFSVPLDKGTHDWLQYTVVATASKDYTSITAGVISSLASGRVNVDDVTLVR